MNLLCEVDFPGGTRYFAKKRQFLSGKQYVAAILSGGQIQQVMDRSGGYRVSVSNLTIQDEKRDIRNGIISGQPIQGSAVRFLDETGTLLNTSILESWAPRADSIEFRFTNRVQVKEKFTRSVLDGPWDPQYINPEIRSMIIPQVYNTYARVVAPLVDNRVNDGGIWLLGTRPITSVTKYEVGGREWNSSYWELRNDGTYWWVYMGHGVIMGEQYGNPQLAYIDVTTPAYTPVQIITSALSGVLTVGTNAAFSAWLTARGFNSTNVHYFLGKDRTPEQILSDFCRNFNCGWRFDANNEVIFEFIDRTSVVVEKTFSSGISRAEIPGGITAQGFYDPVTVKNRIQYRYNYDPKKNEFNGYDEYIGADLGYGTHDHSIDFEFIGNYPTAALDIAQETYQLNREPSTDISFSTSYGIGKGIHPGSHVQIQHRDLRTTNLLFGVVTQTAIDHTRNTVSIDVQDIDFIYPTLFLLDETGIPICFDGELLLLE